MSISLDPKRNQLLAALPPAEWARWLPQLEPVEMPLGGVLYEAGGEMSHVYFPVNSIVSLQPCDLSESNKLDAKDSPNFFSTFGGNSSTSNSTNKLFMLLLSHQENGQKKPSQI